MNEFCCWCMNLIPHDTGSLQQLILLKNTQNWLLPWLHLLLPQYNRHLLTIREQQTRGVLEDIITKINYYYNG